MLNNGKCIAKVKESGIAKSRDTSGIEVDIVACKVGQSSDVIADIHQIEVRE